MEIAISFALALFLSTALVPVVMRYASVLGLVDLPDGDRKLHLDPIPRCGGIAIAIAVFIPTLLWLGDLTSLFGFFAGALIIAIFGFLDDRHDLSYQWKFFGQIVGVLVFLVGNVDVTKTPFLGMGDLMPWVSYPLMALFILGVTNAVNLSDGLDGLAAGSSLLSLGFIAYLGYTAGELSLTLIAVATMGALMGFLRFNTHPATVFMGDAGSQFLGYVTACLALMTTQSSSSAVSPLIAVVLVGLPVLDTLMVMALRMRDGQSPFYPDRRHLHHQFLTLGLLHYQAVAALYVLNFLLLSIAYFVRFEEDIVVLLSYLLFCTVALGSIAFLKNSAYAKRRRALRADNKERRNLVLRRFGWFYHYGGTAIQCLLGVVWLVCVVLADRCQPVAGWIGVVAIVVTGMLWWLFKPNSRVYSRFALYSVSVLSIFVASFQQDVYTLGWGSSQFLVDILLGALALLLAISIRMTRREQFSLDTQDVLVLLILLSAPLLPLGGESDHEIIGTVIRLAVLLYAAEYIIGRSKNLFIANVFALITFCSVVLRAL